MRLRVSEEAFVAALGGGERGGADGGGKVLKVSATQDDIRNGVYMDCNRCPIALAVRRATGGRFCSASEQAILIDNWERGATGSYRTPAEARRFIRAFDCGKPVGTFEFETKVLE